MIDTEIVLGLVIALGGLAVIAAVPIMVWYWLATYDAREDDDDDGDIW